MKRKKKISITIHPRALRRVNSRSEALGLSRSAYINMQLMKKKRKR